MSIQKKESLRSPEELPFSIPVVVDTNVLIYGSSGESPACQTIIDLLYARKLQLVYTRSIRGEFEAIATGYRFNEGRWRDKIMPRADRQLIRHLFEEGIDVSREKERKLTDLLPTEDPSDKKFVVAARKSNCVSIISNDYHLLSLANYEGFEDITVLTPKEFLEKFGFTS